MLETLWSLGISIGERETGEWEVSVPAVRVELQPQGLLLSGARKWGDWDTEAAAG